MQPEKVVEVVIQLMSMKNNKAQDQVIKVSSVEENEADSDCDGE